eukprot:9498445-Pyramimonas_sp.AAC.1
MEKRRIHHSLFEGIIRYSRGPYSFLTIVFDASFLPSRSKGNHPLSRGVVMLAKRPRWPTGVPGDYSGHSCTA